MARSLPATTAAGCLLRAVAPIALVALGVLCVIGATGALSQPADSQKPRRAVTERTLSRLLLQAAAFAGKRIVAVGEHGYIIYSDDSGKTWMRAPSLRRAMLTAVAFADDKIGGAAGHDGQILATRDSGTTWTEQRYKPDDKLPLFALHFSDASHGFALGAYGLFLETANGGGTWSARPIVQEDRHLYAIAADATGRMAIAAEAGTLLLSQDRGATWAMAASPYKGSFFGLVLPSDGALLAYGLRGNVFRSSDFGKSWTASRVDGSATLQGGAQLAGGEIVLVGSAGVVLSSGDNGASFLRVAGQKAITYSAVLPVSSGALLLGESGAIQYRLSGPAAGAASAAPVVVPNAAPASSATAPATTMPAATQPDAPSTAAGAPAKR